MLAFMLCLLVIFGFKLFRRLAFFGVKTVLLVVIVAIVFRLLTRG